MSYKPEHSVAHALCGQIYWSDQFMSKKHIIGNKVTVTSMY